MTDTKLSLLWHRTALLVPITLCISCFTVSKLNVPTYGHRDSLCSWLITPNCDSDFRSTWTEKTSVSNHHLNQKGIFQNSKKLWLVRKYVTMKQREGFSNCFNFWRTLLFTKFPEYSAKFLVCTCMCMCKVFLGRIICLKWKLIRLQAMSVLQACPTYHVQKSNRGVFLNAVPVCRLAVLARQLGTTQ